MKKRFLLYPALFFSILACCCAMLFLAGRLPQARIEQNAKKALAVFQTEGVYPEPVYSGNETYRLDNYTDGIMLNASVYMNTRASAAGWRAILENPKYSETGNGAEDFMTAAEDGFAVPANANYVRYWMGFRATLRTLLSIGSYYQIRRLQMWCILLLCALILSRIAKRSGIPACLAFTVAFLAVNPIAVLSSLQYGCCFLIAFSAMLLVDAPRLRRLLPLPALFLLCGMLTQFFDFYTYPLLTFGAPMLMLLLCPRSETDARSGRAAFKLTLKCLALWLSGYVLMWLAKLTLTTLLTDIDGFANGFRSLSGRLGIEKTASLTAYYSVSRALSSCLSAVVSRESLLVLAIAAIVWALRFFPRVERGKRACANLPLLFVAALPLVWFAVARQPSAIHWWFQYRSLFLTFFGLGGFFIQSLKTAAQPGNPLR